MCSFLGDLAQYGTGCIVYDAAVVTSRGKAVGHGLDHVTASHIVTF